MATPSVFSAMQHKMTTIMTQSKKITDDENQCSTMKDHRVVAYHKGRMLGVVQKALMVHLDEHENFPTDLNSPAQEEESIHLN